MSTTLSRSSTNSTTDYLNDPDIPLPTYITWISIVSFSTSAVVGIALYIPIFVVIIAKRKKFLANSFYKFLLTLGVAEVVSLFCYGLFSSFCLLRGWQLGTSGRCPVPLLLNYTIGNISWIVWYVEFFVHPLIAFDRFMAICFYMHYSRVLEPKRAIVMCITAWLGACVVAAPCITGYLPVAFFVSLLSSFVDSNSEAVTIYNYCFLVFEYTMLVVAALLYAVCCAVLIVRRRRGLTRVADKNAASSSSKMKAQRKLTIQAAVHFSWLASFLIMWAVMGDIPNIWLYFTMNMVEQIICLNTPIVTLWLNDAIREEVASLMRRKSSSNQVSAGGIGEAKNRRANH